MIIKPATTNGIDSFPYFADCGCCGAKEGRNVANMGRSVETSFSSACLVITGAFQAGSGANIGTLSLHGAKLVGKKGRVVAVEPQPRQAEALRIVS